MAYFIRQEGKDSVAFWRGPKDPFGWVYHSSDAAQFPSVAEARMAFWKATGNFPYRRTTVVGGP